MKPRLFGPILVVLAWTQPVAAGSLATLPGPVWSSARCVRSLGGDEKRAAAKLEEAHSEQVRAFGEPRKSLSGLVRTDGDPRRKKWQCPLITEGVSREPNPYSLLQEQESFSELTRCCRALGAEVREGDDIHDLISAVEPLNRYRKEKLCAFLLNRLAVVRACFLVVAAGPVCQQDRGQEPPSACRPSSVDVAATAEACSAPGHLTQSATSGLEVLLASYQLMCMTDPDSAATAAMGESLRTLLVQMREHARSADASDGGFASRLASAARGRKAMREGMRNRTTIQGMLDFPRTISLGLADDGRPALIDVVRSLTSESVINRAVGMDRVAESTRIRLELPRPVLAP